MPHQCMQHLTNKQHEMHTLLNWDIGSYTLTSTPLQAFQVVANHRQSAFSFGENSGHLPDGSAHCTYDAVGSP